MKTIREDQLKEKYKILNECEQVAKIYDRPHGVILQNRGTFAEDSGAYFAIGSDMETIKGIKFPSIIADNYKYNRSYFDSTIFVIKLDNEKGTLILDLISKYFINLYFLRDCLYEKNYPIPEKVNRTEIIKMMNVYERLANCPAKEEEGIFQEFGIIVDSIGKGQNKKGFSKLWKDFKSSERYNANSRAIEIMLSFVTYKKKKVSLKQLNRMSSGIRSITIKKRTYSKFKKAIKKDNSIVYSIDRLKNSQYQLYFKAEDEYKIMRVIHEIYLGKTVLDAENIFLSERNYGGITIPNSHVYRFKEICKNREIPYALDNGYISFSRINKVPILFFSEHSKYILDVLNQVQREVLFKKVIDQVNGKIDEKRQKLQKKATEENMKKTLGVDRIEMLDDKNIKRQTDLEAQKRYFDDKIKIKEAIEEMKNIQQI